MYPGNPNDENWRREKQGLPPLASNPPRPPSSAEEAQWLREKQGLSPQPPASPQEAQWMREKQGLPPLAVAPGSAPKAGAPLWLWLGLAALVIGGVVAALVLVVLPGNKSGSPAGPTG